jgi:hypothetical protein
MRLHAHGEFARFRYNDLKEAARDLRRTWALCKFNGGAERRRAVPRRCCRARHMTVGGRKLAEFEKRVASSVVEEPEKDLRSEGRHRGAELVEKHL